MSALTIRKVETSADFRAFFEFPWVLYQNEPNWVPPLLSMRRELLDRQKNPAWEYLEGDHFTAWRGDQLVGTISAHINHRHNEFRQEHIGWFGTFEVYNDQEAASALLNTAAEWVKAKGYTAIRGPQSFTTHEEVGVLVNNFTPPMILMPYNPPYYQTLIEQTSGFEKAMDVHSVYYDREVSQKYDSIPKMEKIVQRAIERSGIGIRPIDLKRKREEFAIFKNIYNAAWERNWSFVPMTERELDGLIESLGMFFEPSMAFFATVHGEIAGFALAIPDFNEVLHKVYPRPGVPEVWSLLQAGYYWKIKKMIRGVRLPLMGVLEEHRGKGLEMLMLLTMFKALEPTQYRYLDASWILETNQLLSIVAKIGGFPYKTHRFYEKKLS
jgi:GNAT superfamily N-acetyltransferase